VVPLLETLRSLERPPVLVPVHVLQTEEESGDGVKTEAAMTPAEAHFAAVHALYHAFAVRL
jgi:hypothetical protein